MTSFHLSDHELPRFAHVNAKSYEKKKKKKREKARREGREGREGWNVFVQLIEIPLPPPPLPSPPPFSHFTRKAAGTSKKIKSYTDRVKVLHGRSFSITGTIPLYLSIYLFFFLLSFFSTLPFDQSPKWTARRWNILAGGGGEGGGGGGGKTKSRDFLGRPEEKKRSATYRLIDSWCLPRMLALPFKELLLAGGRGIVARTTMKMSKNREQTALSTDPI